MCCTCRSFGISHAFKDEFLGPCIVLLFCLQSILFTFVNRYMLVSIFQNIFQMLYSLWIFGIHCSKVGLSIWTPNFRYVNSVNLLLTFCSCQCAHSLQQVGLKYVWQSYAHFACGNVLFVFCQYVHVLT